MIHPYDSTSRTSCCRGFSLLLAAWLLALGAGPAAAQLPGISYTLSPIGSRVYWSDDATLSDDFLYGGELGLGFGQFLEFGGIYLTGNRFETDFSNLSGDNAALLDAIAGLPARDVQVQRYGGKLRVNLGVGRFVPFVTAGTGIIRFNPDGLEDSENIYLNGGAGLTFSVANRYSLSVAGEYLAYRFNVGSTFFSQADLDQLGLSVASFNQQTVYNPALSASLKLYLGGRSREALTDVDRAMVQQFARGNFRLAVEPFYGQIEFADALGFPSSQALVGVQAGFDLGPYVGVRGFYWQATEEQNVFDQGPTSFTQLAFYGAEMDLRIDRQLAGLTPYLVLGGGYMDVGREYEDFSGVRPDSRYFAIGGVGLEVPLVRSIKLQGAVRGLFMSTEDVADVSDPSGVQFSPMYTVGVNFNVGRPGRQPEPVLAGTVDELQAERRIQQSEMEQELARLQARIDSLEAARATPSLAEGRSATQMDTVVVSGAQTAGFAGRTMTIPVPEEGEIYIRFGSPAGASVETVYAPPAVITGSLTPAGFQPAARVDTARAALRDTTVAGGLTAEQVRLIVRQALAEQPQAGLTGDDLQAMEERLEARIARETTQLRTDLQPPPAAGEGEEGETATTTRRDNTVVGTFQQRDLESLWPIIGVRSGEGPEQLLVGARLDYAFPGQRYRLMPELAFGFSDEGVALSALGNVAYPFFGNFVESVQPYVGAGVGLVSDSGIKGLDLTFNLMVGTQYSLPNGMTFFAEYGTLDFFDFNRFLVGYRFSF